MFKKGYYMRLSLYFLLGLLFATSSLPAAGSGEVVKATTVLGAIKQGNATQLEHLLTDGRSRTYLGLAGPESSDVLANKKGHKGQTPLHLAVDLDKYQCAQVLVNYGAIQIADDSGNTPADIAVCKDLPNMLKLMVNASDLRDFLEEAANIARPNCLRVLLDEYEISSGDKETIMSWVKTKTNLWEGYGYDSQRTQAGRVRCIQMLNNPEEE